LTEANGGRELDVVLEMTGEHTLQAAMAATAPFGRVVIFGFASGKTAVVDTMDVMTRSQSLIGFVLPQLFRRRDALAQSLRELFALVRSGELVPHVGAEYGLSEVRRAHEQLQARATTGKLTLDPAR
jgi:NADPH2:quinone reductase